ncbi:unnamed protein product, partial [Nesidiocoris tenuis]
RVHLRIMVMDQEGEAATMQSCQLLSSNETSKIQSGAKPSILVPTRSSKRGVSVEITLSKIAITEKISMCPCARLFVC